MTSAFSSCAFGILNSSRLLSRAVVSRPLSALSPSCSSTMVLPRPSTQSLLLHQSPVGSRFLSMFLGASSSNCLLSLRLSSFTASAMLSPMRVSVQPSRTRILFSYNGGKPETVQDVVDRFFRLHNGLWIRTKSGRNKKKWAKTPARVHRLKEHVVCNRTQCQLLDKMVNREYRLPKNYVDDVYAPYHRKSNLPDYRYLAPKFLP